MTVIKGNVGTLKEAIPLVFRTARVEGMQPEVVHLFRTMLERQESKAQVLKLIGGVVRNNYGKEAGWRDAHWWEVPVPTPIYEARGMPSLIFETRTYVVASMLVDADRFRSSRHISVVEALAKPQTTLLPLCFLQALLDGKEQRYPVVGKDGDWTSWDILGLKQPIRIHDKFRSELVNTLRRKPVADWLDDFGSAGRSLAPIIIGVLLGLRYRRATASLPVEQQPWNRETLLEVITSLGYSTARAQGVLAQAEPELRPGITLEEATRTVLKYIAGEAPK